ncbi:hypothetical protein K440DRAFT_635957 [Wilcoxina mikolae CBS 423.85]|nr:hypothetical protein K440DRAFT_635957 [Wilcoxina mikolae CBS 423.85]
MAFARNGAIAEDGKFGVIVQFEVREMHSHLPEGITLFASLHMELAELDLLDQENEDSVKPYNFANTTLDHIIGDYADSWSRIRKNHSIVSIAGHRHAACIVPENQMLEKFAPLLDGIASLTFTSYVKRKIPVENVTWDVITRPECSEQHNIYHEICPYGDLEICFSTVGTTFLVSSHALRTVSSVFRDLLGPTSDFAEHSRRDKTQDTPSCSNSDTSKLYKLVLDTVYDPAVVAVALYAMHGQGNMIPDDIDFPYLYDLAVLCEDYRCAFTLMPWCQNWIEKWRWTIEEPGYGGVLTPFLNIPARDDELTFNTQDEIAAQEHTARRRMGEVCRNLYGRWCNPSVINCHFGNTPTGKICDRLIFAMIHWGFKKMQLLKGKTIEIAPDIPLWSVARDIKTVLDDTVTDVRLTMLGGKSHTACGDFLRNVSTNVQTLFNEIRPLSLSLFGRKKSVKIQVSWGEMFPGVTGWESESEPEPEPESPFYNMYDNYGGRRRW